jgi:hypothetical protein
MTGQGWQPTTPFRNRTVFKRDPFFPSEDCLFLKYELAFSEHKCSSKPFNYSVYTPGEISSIKKKLPVVIWIHGWVFQFIVNIPCFDGNMMSTGVGMHLGALQVLSEQMHMTATT